MTFNDPVVRRHFAPGYPWVQKGGKCCEMDTFTIASFHLGEDGKLKDVLLREPDGFQHLMPIRRLLERYRPVSDTAYERMLEGVV